MHLEQFLEKVANVENDFVKLSSEELKVLQLLSDAYLKGFQDGMIKKASKSFTDRLRELSENIEILNELHPTEMKTVARGNLIFGGLLGLGAGALGMRYYLKKKQKQQNLVKKSNENNIVLTAFTDDQIKRLKRKNLILGGLLGLGAGALGTRYYLKRKQKNK